MLTDALLPGVMEERARRAEDNRAFTLRLNSDGSGWIARGELDLECGERLHAVLQAELARDPDNPADTATAQDLRAAGHDPAGSTPPGGAPPGSSFPQAWAGSGPAGCTPAHALHLKAGRRPGPDGWVT